LPKFQGHRRWFRPWIVMKGEKFSTSITWVGNYNHSHLSYPWIDLIKVRVQTSMNRSLLARSKLTNVLSHPSQSYFLPNPSPGIQNCANFTAWGTVHHISHQPLQLSRSNKGYRHKQEGSLQLLLNLQDCTTTSHKGIPWCITPKSGHHRRPAADDADAEHHRKPAYYFFDGIALKGIGGPNYVHVAANDCY
jgi:hypothetical protein